MTLSGWLFPSLLPLLTAFKIIVLVSWYRLSWQFLCQNLQFMVCCTLRAHYNVSLFSSYLLTLNLSMIIFTREWIVWYLSCWSPWGLLRLVPKRWMSDFEIGCNFPWILWLWSSFGGRGRGVEIPLLLIFTAGLSHLAVPRLRFRRRPLGGGAREVCSGGFSVIRHLRVKPWHKSVCCSSHACRSKQQSWRIWGVKLTGWLCITE